VEERPDDVVRAVAKFQKQLADPDVGIKRASSLEALVGSYAPDYEDLAYSGGFAKGDKYAPARAYFEQEYGRWKTNPQMFDSIDNFAKCVVSWMRIPENKIDHPVETSTIRKWLKSRKWRRPRPKK
jgi:hypothetical protein